MAPDLAAFAAAAAERGGRPCRRATDLAIAATASLAGVPLVTHNDADFQIVADLIHVETP